MKLVVKTDKGRKRGTNQDFANTYKNQNGLTLAVLCDGMGGHRAGDIASEMVVSHLGNNWEKTKLQSAKKAAEWLKRRVNRENQRLVEKASQYPDLKGMGTTLVAVAEAEDGYVIANIGDSRAYRLINNHLTQITDDHSLVGELMRNGQLTEEEALNHPQKNVLTRSLGVEETLGIDIDIYAYESNSPILLCSDGLTNMVADEEIEKILNTSDSLKSQAAMLIDLANERGGIDNITVVIIYLNERKEE
ncbi:Stp1/IreP family PP2C-type Ser/Thr phosphatase [Desemzia sp. RIT804]|uniref:Stp1/IreP family PP2C-type Ser/Thr phosphatase n=1 Tax=Desemzia sp. RIT 804 TaxID=2810209 RepID=UPI00195175FD|nr:Stp1/IreP family PP2C-type Ser/Thr phosphatase [Desemzia sp. RIT 804]MBM6613661.1 Stp1/IreP family PP2C-type Ser/Thr phosphatase [Desemzia sp. RIT 804]